MAQFLQNRATSSAETYGVLPVWRRISLQLLIMSTVCGILVLGNEFLQPILDTDLSRILSLALVPIPVILWLLLSVLPEYRSARPRRRLIGVAVVSGLTASAIGLPIVETFYAVGQWLPLQSVFQRIVGYTVTAGIVDTGLKFLVLRYLVYSQGLRVRSDAVAYAVASAVGYSFYLNLALVWRLEPTWDSAAITVLASLTMQTAASLFIALGLVESYFAEAFPLVLPINLLVAAFTTGVITALLPGLMSGPLSQAGSTDRPLFGLMFLLASWIVTLGIVYFLFSNSERREREAYVGRGDIDGI